MALGPVPVPAWGQRTGDVSVLLCWGLFVQHSCTAAAELFTWAGGLVFSDQCEGVLVTFYLLPPTRL